MNGSYSVPIGSSRSPLMECDRPSADSRMKRFISAMPSSMCWPFGENSQLNVEGMRSLLKVSAMLSRANKPRRLTHGPRLVETVTSGEGVTIRSASSDFSRASSFNRAPKPACVAVRERPAVEETLQRRGRQAQALERIPFVAGPNVHRGAEGLHLSFG